jgi:hypothetical protein
VVLEEEVQRVFAQHAACTRPGLAPHTDSKKDEREIIRTAALNLAPVMVACRTAKEDGGTRQLAELQ